MTNEKTKTIYIVDDDTDDRRRVLDILKTLPVQVVPFQGGTQFIEARIERQNACVLLDVRMPDIDGLTVVKFMSETHPEVPVIMLSGQSTLPVAVEAMKRGAVDFLEKPVAREDLVRALERAFTIRPPADPQRLTREELLNKVTRREGQVLELLVQGHPNKVVAYQLGIAENTVEVHRQRLMKRLKVRTFADLVRVAVRAGI